MKKYLNPISIYQPVISGFQKYIYTKKAPIKTKHSPSNTLNIDTLRTVITKVFKVEH